jgi:hypothetical protein
MNDSAPCDRGVARLADSVEVGVLIDRADAGERGDRRVGDRREEGHRRRAIRHQHAEWAIELGPGARVDGSSGQPGLVQGGREGLVHAARCRSRSRHSVAAMASRKTGSTVAPTGSVANALPSHLLYGG